MAIYSAVTSVSLYLFKHPFSDYAVTAAQSLISLLDAVDNYPCLYFNQTVLANAIRRYELLWLPLLLSVPCDTVTPPLDIHWVWVCHMLCPRKYIRDSLAIYRKLTADDSVSSYTFDHSFPPPDDYAKRYAIAKALWCDRYGPDEPFDICEQLSTEPVICPSPSPSESNTYVPYAHPSLISYDVATAASRQMMFHYQVGISPHYRTSSFLRSAAHRYKKFVFLKHRHVREILVPTYDIDLMWHAHMCHPIAYGRDTAVKLNVLPHDDTLNDRSAGGKLLNQWAITKPLWYESFHRPMSTPGGMWRGNISVEERAYRDDQLQNIRRVDGLNFIERRLNAHVSMLMEHDDHEIKAMDKTKYDAVQWVHNTEFAQFLLQSNEETNPKFVHCDTPFKRRLSTLVHGGQSRLVGCTTTFVSRSDIRNNQRVPLLTIELFTTQPSIPIASAHTFLPGTVSLFPPIRGLRGDIAVLRIAGTDRGMIAVSEECIFWNESGTATWGKMIADSNKEKYTCTRGRVVIEFNTKQMAVSVIALNDGDNDDDERRRIEKEDIVLAYLMLLAIAALREQAIKSAK